MAFSCAICRELLNRDPAGPPAPGTGERVMDIVSLSCGHVFHKVCIQTWFSTKMSNRCAVCKKRVADRRIRKLYLCGAEEEGEEEVEELNQLKEENEELVKKIEDLKSSKKTVEGRLAKVTMKAKLQKLDLALVRERLKIEELRVDHLTEELQEKSDLLNRAASEAEAEKKRLRESWTSFELGEMDRQARVAKLKRKLFEENSNSPQLEEPEGARVRKLQRRNTPSRSRSPAPSGSSGSEDDGSESSGSPQRPGLLRRLLLK